MTHPRYPKGMLRCRILLLWLVVGFAVGPARLAAGAVVPPCGDVGDAFTEAIEDPTSIRLVRSAANRKRPPDGVPYIVLGTRSGSGSTTFRRTGVTTEYHAFAQAMTERLGHAAVTFDRFVEFKLVAHLTPFVSQDVGRAVERLVGPDDATGLAQGARAILVKLDGFDPADPVKGYAAGSRGGVTAAELRNMLENKRYFTATRWFRAGRELTAAEVRTLFEPYFPDLFR
jgi:hypothetical protein